uniref:Uncharacterized protein n=1 Tax=mine drainage metagenome TaxID=410659 RepID=E6Q3I7_9ZZZZ
MTTQTLPAPTVTRAPIGANNTARLTITIPHATSSSLSCTGGVALNGTNGFSFTLELRP